MYYVPLWMLAVCLPVSALAVYLGLRETGISRGLLYVLTAALSPVLLLVVAFAAVVSSTALSAAFEEPVDAPGRPASEGRPSREQSPEPTSPKPTSPAPTAPTTPAASPSASPTASPSASPAGSASPAADQ